MEILFKSKKALIENFIAGINDVSDVMVEWRQYVAEEKERQLRNIPQEIIDRYNNGDTKSKKMEEIAYE